MAQLLLSTGHPFEAGEMPRRRRRAEGRGRPIFGMILAAAARTHSVPSRYAIVLRVAGDRSELLRRHVRPAREGPPEVRRLIEPQHVACLFDRHIGVSEVLDRELQSQFVAARRTSGS
jgi:hypothetical protein